MKVYVVGIYKITSPSGKVYIGQSADIFQRWRAHESEFKNQNKTTNLHNSFSEHGFENHIFEVVKPCEKFELDELERYYQEEYLENSLNMLLTKTNNSPAKHSEETRVKMSESHKGIIFSEEHRKQISKVRLGMTFSEEHRKNMSESRKGKVTSEETKQKMRESHARRKLNKKQ